MNVRILILTLLFFSSAVAQKRKAADTLAPLREFMAVATGYKQLPMYMELEMRNSSTLILNEEDTTVTKGIFYLQPHNAYVQFGNFEQIVNDSTALLVIPAAKVMMLYENAAPVVKQMRAMLTAAIPDSSIPQLAERYTSTIAEGEKGNSVIELQSRELLYRTPLHRETINLVYNTTNKTPLSISTIRRSLLSIDSAEYDSLKARPLLADKLLNTDEGYFLLREQQSIIVYNKILRDKDAEMDVPVLINQRVVRGKDGEYRPVKKFEDYIVTIND